MIRIILMICVLIITLLIIEIKMFQKMSISYQLQKVFKRSLHIKQKKVGILGVPCDKGQKKSGVALGPQALRDGGLIKELCNLSNKMDIKDYGDINYAIKEKANGYSVFNMVNYPHIPACNFELSKMTEQIINEGRICLTLGGDHSIGLGSVDGHIKAKKDVCVLWVDAHADLNTNETSDTGNVHGMPMALLAAELSDYWPDLPGMDWQKPRLSLKNVAYIGLRSVDPHEKLFIDKFDVAAYGMEEVDKYGIRNVVSLALDRIDRENNKSIHVSFDIDSLDSLEAPSTGTPVRGGLTLREGMQIMEMIYETGRLNAIDLVEVNPTIGSDTDVKKTIDAALHILLAAFGQKRGGIIPEEVLIKKYINQGINENVIK